MNAVSKKDLGGLSGNLQFGQEPADGGSFFHFHHAGVFAVLFGKVISEGGVKDKLDFHRIRPIRLWRMKKVHPREQEGISLFASQEMTRSLGGFRKAPSDDAFS
jgi:hypothetical protein